MAERLAAGGADRETVGARHGEGELHSEGAGQRGRAKHHPRVLVRPLHRGAHAAEPQPFVEQIDKDAPVRGDGPSPPWHAEGAAVRAIAGRSPRAQRRLPVVALRALVSVQRAGEVEEPPRALDVEPPFRECLGAIPWPDPERLARGVLPTHRKPRHVDAVAGRQPMLAT